MRQICCLLANTELQSVGCNWGVKSTCSLVLCMGYSNFRWVHWCGGAIEVNLIFAIWHNSNHTSHLLTPFSEILAHHMLDCHCTGRPVGVWLCFATDHCASVWAVYGWRRSQKYTVHIPVLCQPHSKLECVWQCTWICTVYLHCCKYLI